MLVWIFIILHLLTVPLAILSLFFSVTLLSRRGNAIYFYFGMASLSLGSWLITTYFEFSTLALLSRELLANATFFFGAWVLHFFFLFTCEFPIRKKEFTKYYPFFYVIILIISLSSFYPNLYTLNASLLYPFLYISINPIGLTIFILYFAIFCLLAYRNLLSSYFDSDGIYRVQLRKILIGGGLAMAINLLLNMGAYYFIQFDFNLVGTFSVFLILVYTYSILFSGRP